MRSLIKMEDFPPGPHLSPSSSRVGLLPASHDADHLLPGGLSHESPVDDPRHVVVAAGQTDHRPVAPDSRHQALRFGLSAAAELPRESQPCEGHSLHPLPRQGHSFLGAAAAHVPDELLDEPSVPLGAGLRPTSCGSGGFPCRRLTSRTGPVTGPWGSKQVVIRKVEPKLSHYSFKKKKKVISPPSALQRDSVLPECSTTLKRLDRPSVRPLRTGLSLVVVDRAQAEPPPPLMVRC